MYLRKSRAEEGMSTDEVLAKHKAALLDLADRLGIVVEHIYEEVVSGEKLYARPEMLKLLERIRAGEVDAVLCMDIDRLGRGGVSGWDRGQYPAHDRQQGACKIFAAPRLLRARLGARASLAVVPGCVRAGRAPGLAHFCDAGAVF